MSRIEDRLAELGLELPEPFRPPGGGTFRFERVRVHDGLAFVSGHGPLDGERLLATGKIGQSSWKAGQLLTLEQGRWAARAAGLSILASLREELGDLDRVSEWLKVLAFINCGEGFNQTVPVADGFTELIVELWGAEGLHARSAVGVSVLPFDIPVEIEAIVAVD